MYRTAIYSNYIQYFIFPFSSFGGCTDSPAANGTSGIHAVGGSDSGHNGNLGNIRFLYRDSGGNPAMGDRVLDGFVSQSMTKAFSASVRVFSFSIIAIRSSSQ